MNTQPGILDSTVGSEALVSIPFRQPGVRFRVRCKVGGWRRAYGRVEFNVSPIAGDGATWIASKHVQIEKTCASSVHGLEKQSQ